MPSDSESSSWLDKKDSSFLANLISAPLWEHSREIDDRTFWANLKRRADIDCFWSREQVKNAVLTLPIIHLVNCLYHIFEAIRLSVVQSLCFLSRRGEALPWSHEILLKNHFNTKFLEKVYCDSEFLSYKGTVIVNFSFEHVLRISSLKALNRHHVHHLHEYNSVSAVSTCYCLEYCSCSSQPTGDYHVFNLWIPNSD